MHISSVLRVCQSNGLVNHWPLVRLTLLEVSYHLN